MKKEWIALAITISLFLFGCDGEKTQEQKDMKYWHVIKIDSCEYIESSRWNDIPLIHKSNCKNPIHKK